MLFDIYHGAMDGEHASYLDGYTYMTKRSNHVIDIYFSFSRQNRPVSIDEFYYQARRPHGELLPGGAWRLITFRRQLRDEVESTQIINFASSYYNLGSTKQLDTYQRLKKFTPFEFRYNATNGYGVRSKLFGYDPDTWINFRDNGGNEDDSEYNFVIEAKDVIPDNGIGLIKQIAKLRARKLEEFL